MAWTGTWPCGAGADLTDPAFIGQFVKAIAERMLAVNQTPQSFPTAGAVINFESFARLMNYSPTPNQTWNVSPWRAVWPGFCGATLSIRAMQDWVETYCGLFADHVNNPGGFAGAAAIAPWTVANLRAAAGLNAGGFTRVYYDSGRAIQTAYGVAHDLDIAGPWLFNELRAMLNLLLWTWLPSVNPYFGGHLSWQTKGENNYQQGSSPDWVYGQTWPNAQAAALTAFTGSSLSIGDGPRAFSRGLYNALYSGYQANLYRAYAYLAWDKASPLTADTVFYFKAQTIPLWNPPGNTVFDANGDTAADGALSVADTQTITGAGTKYSAEIGSTAAAPAWCAQPAVGGPPHGPEEIHGYQGDPTASGWLLAKWNVAGGFQFT